MSVGTAERNQRILQWPARRTMGSPHYPSRLTPVQQRLLGAINGRTVPAVLAQLLHMRVPDLFVELRRLEQMDLIEWERAFLAHEQKATGQPAPRSVPAPSDGDVDERLEIRRRQMLVERKARQRRRLLASSPLPHDPSKAEARFREGLKHLEAGSRAAAAACFQLAISHDPGNPKYREHFEAANRRQG